MRETEEGREWKRRDERKGGGRIFFPCTCCIYVRLTFPCVARIPNILVCPPSVACTRKHCDRESLREPKCLEHRCSDVFCALFCENGFKKDEHVCLLCARVFCMCVRPCMHVCVFRAVLHVGMGSCQGTLHFLVYLPDLYVGLLLTYSHLLSCFLWQQPTATATTQQGCDICECREPCEEVLCELFCEHGFQTDEHVRVPVPPSFAHLLSQTHTTSLAFTS